MQTLYYIKKLFNSLNRWTRVLYSGQVLICLLFNYFCVFSFYLLFLRFLLFVWMVLAFPLVLHSRKELVLRLRLPGWLETSVQFFQAKILKAVCLVPEVGISFGVKRTNRELKVEQKLPYLVVLPI